MTTTTTCPVCEAEVPLSADALVHELIDCAECATELEIASLEPPLLKEAPTEEEDWGE
jgi:alpha-aminoadipate carrier protein LysW